MSGPLPSKLIDTKKRKRGRAPRFKLSTYLVSYTIDNIVFRHEIRMSSFSQLRPSSPVVQTHFMMVALLITHGLITFFAGFPGLLVGAMVLMAGMAGVMYPLMLRRANDNLRNEAHSGAWDQLVLTSLTHKEVFEGKYFGLMSPIFELQRYLNLFSLILVADGAWLMQDWWIIPHLLAYCLMMRNQIDLGARMGTLGGFDGAAKKKRLMQMLFLSMEYNPYIPQIIVGLKYLVHMILPLLISLVALRVIRDDFFWKVVLAIQGCALLYIPIMSAHDLRNKEVKLREKQARNFKYLFRGKKENWNVI